MKIVHCNETLRIYMRPEYPDDFQMLLTLIQAAQKGGTVTITPNDRKPFTKIWAKGAKIEPGGIVDALGKKPNIEPPRHPHTGVEDGILI
jgi:hypothetical protein